MSGTALALVLTAALLHATWNLAIKGAGGEDRVAFVWLYILLCSAIWTPIGAVWVLVTGESPTWWWLGAPLVSAVLHVVYQLALQRGYAEGDLNLVYPLARGAGPMLTFLFAVTVLDQHPGPEEVLGVLAIVSGVLLISLGARAGRLRADRAGVIWGLATGATIAAYTLWDNHSVNGLDLPPVPYFVLNLVLQLPFLAVLLVRRRDPTPVREVWTSARTAALTVALLSPLAYLLVLRAMQLAPVALVAAARESSIVVGAVFGWLVLREPRPARRLVGAVVVLVGIGLIAVG
ncbi:MAG TPA: DMT family transporter [Nocardioides sp.]|nr:DMT family transporter [Nocardioides sp.]